MLRLVEVGVQDHEKDPLNLDAKIGLEQLAPGSDAR